MRIPRRYQVDLCVRSASKAEDLRPLQILCIEANPFWSQSQFVHGISPRPAYHPPIEGGPRSCIDSSTVGSAHILDELLDASENKLPCRLGIAVYNTGAGHEEHEAPINLEMGQAMDNTHRRI
ncbi:unnamed protein product [Aspergillus niger]|nr:unnamed protein product [Aspergillus niger]